MVARLALPLAASLVLLGCPAPRHVPPPPPPLRPTPSVPLPKVAPLPEAPERIPHTFEPARYIASLDIDPGVKTFAGTLTVTGTLAEPTAVLWFHSKSLRVDQATATHLGHSQRLVVRYIADRELLAVQSPDDLAAGEWSITFAYEGIFNANGHSGAFRQWEAATEYVATQFEPDFARHVFPCIDEPDRKVPWQLTINAPADLEVASNMPVLHTTANVNGTKRVEFALTKPLPSYLVAFAVGPFEVVDGGRSKSGIPVRILALRGHRASAKHAASVTAGILDRIEDWLGVPFGYPKLDIVTVPQTPNWWYAMENPGLVTIDISALTDPPKYDRVIGHEIAHHWFGDLATLAWWDELWLNESFAEWVARAAEGEPPIAQAGGASPIIMPVREGRHAFPPGEGIETKAPALLSRLHGYLGAARFKTVLQTYLNSHAHGTVTSASFLDALRSVDTNSATLAEAYITNKESSLRTSLECKGKQFRIAVTGVDNWGITCFAYDRDGTRGETCSGVTHAQPTITLDIKRCPTWVLGENLSPSEVVALTALRDTGWDQLTGPEHERIARLVGDTTPDLRWSFMPKLVQLTEPFVRDVVASMISFARDLIDDAATRDALDAWVRATYGGLAKQIDFEQAPALAMLLATSGDPTLLEKARALDARAAAHRAADQRTARDTYVVWAQTALARASKKDATVLFERWITAKPPLQFEYAVPLRRSPFVLELLRDNAARARGNDAVLGMMSELCSAPADEITAVATAIDPAHGPTVVDAMTYGRCVVEHKQTSDAVRKFLIPKQP